MKTCNKKIVVTVFLLISAFASSSQTNDWSITTDAGKHVITMSLSNPPTTLQIEDQIVLYVNLNGYPQAGNVRFRDGISRDLNTGEINAYWDKFSAKQALWRYLESQGKLVSVSESSIPEDSYGKMTRVTTQASKEYFGKLQKANDNGQFGILDDNACCGPTIFDKIVVTKIQQLK